MVTGKEGREGVTDNLSFAHAYVISFILVELLIEQCLVHVMYYVCTCRVAIYWES